MSTIDHFQSQENFVIINNLVRIEGFGILDQELCMIVEIFICRDSFIILGNIVIIENEKFSSWKNT